MPIPMDIQHASEEFEKFLLLAKDQAHLTTRNQTYTMVEGVLRTFRSRLSLAQAIRFAHILPPVLRAIFVDDWNIEAAVLSFDNMQTMVFEVQSLRKHHNFAPQNCIEAVAYALRQCVDCEKLDRLLSTFPEGSVRFWA